jgi:hypothetical protein
MKAKITVSLDSEILRKVRTIAAEKHCSISEFLAAQFQEIVQKRNGYARSKKRALARLRNATDHGWIPPDSRDKLHER